MSDGGNQAAPGTVVTRRTAALVGALAASLLLGCDRSSPPSGATEESIEAAAAQSQQLPVYDVAGAARAAYPEVAAFVDEFLNTCLVGDYAGYRRLVSRAYTPETRERFEAIYLATEGVTVESIEPVEIRQIPSPVYRVVSTIDFKPEQQVKLRESHRQVAILVFQEGGEWRMAPAPTELQPQEEAAPPASSAPTASAPTYPWDKDGDY